MKKEYILCSAVWFKEYESNYIQEAIEQARPKNIKEGIVICGQRHLQCLRTFSCITNKPARRDQAGESIQGFLTNINRFVDREEGGRIAFEAGQTKELKKTLYSEDLY